MVKLFSFCNIGQKCVYKLLICLYKLFTLLNDNMNDTLVDMLAVCFCSSSLVFCCLVCYLQVFESLNITAYGLNVDMLDVHAVCHIVSYI